MPFVLGQRTIGFLQKVKLPGETIADKGFKECCYTNIAFADESSSDDYKNDYYGFYNVKQTPGDSCEFVLVDLITTSEYVIIDQTYGDFKAYGDYVGNPNLTTFTVQWKKVLTLLGPGSYQVRKDQTIGSIPTSEVSNSFVLKQFSTEEADKTVRFDVVQNGKLTHFGVDFKNTGFKSSLRMIGFFGRRDPDYVQENDVYRNERVTQNNMSQENEYQFQANSIPSCISDDLFDFFMFGDDIFVNDYNLNNHSYGYKKFGVVYKSNKGTKYDSGHRNAQINMTFEDRFKNKRKINC